MISWNDTQKIKSQEFDYEIEEIAWNEEKILISSKRHGDFLIEKREDGIYIFCCDGGG